MSGGKQIALATAVALGTTAVFWLIARGGWLDPVEWATWSLRARAFAEITDADIRLILIDEASLGWAYEDSQRDRWPRDYNVPILRLCALARAKALVFVDDSTTGDGWNDHRLAEEMASPRGLAIGLAAYFSRLGKAEQKWPAVQGTLEVDGLPEPWLNERGSPIRLGTAEFPVEVLTESALLLGSLTDPPDADKVVRRVQPIQLYDSHFVPPVGLLPFVLGGESLDRVEGGKIHRPLPSVVWQDGRLRFGEDHSAPVDEAGWATLRFRKPDPAWGSSRYPTSSACAAVIAGRELMAPVEARRDQLSPTDEKHCPMAADVDPRQFKDRYVFFGTSRPHLTPVGPATDLEIHATALDNLLTGDFMRQAPARQTVPFTLALTFLGAYAALSSRRWWLLAAAFAACVATAWLVGWWAYPRGSWWPIVEPLTAGVAACALGAGLRYAQYRSLAWAPRRATRAHRRDGDPRFDVFLSHNSRNKPVVRELANALEARGLRVWLDEQELIPGRPWQDALEEVIRDVRSAAILIGDDGPGPWEIAEMRACLSQFVDRGAPVIPVLLPGAPAQPDLPLFLGQLTWVDLRGGFDGLDRLEWGITGVKPGS